MILELPLIMYDQQVEEDKAKKRYDENPHPDINLFEHGITDNAPEISEEEPTILTINSFVNLDNIIFITPGKSGSTQLWYGKDNFILCAMSYEEMQSILYSDIEEESTCSCEK